ncbi:42376_t:CDS:10, partial [Gigaspora margarita]
SQWELETPAQICKYIKKRFHVSESKIPSLGSLYKVYATQRKKKDNGKAEELETQKEKKEAAEDHMHKTKKKEILRITRARRITTTKIAEFCLKQTKVSANFSKEVGILIDQPSTIIIIRVHGEQKCSLGKIDKFPIIVEDKTITFYAVVTNARNYAVIVDWEECKLMIRDRSKKIRIPTKYCKPVNINKGIGKKENSKQNNKGTEREEYTSDDESKKDEDKYEQENLVNKTYLYWEFQEIQNRFGTYQLTTELVKQVNNILVKYKDIFADNSGQLEETSIIQYEIFTENVPHVKQKFYSTSRPKHDFIKTEIQLQEDILYRRNKEDPENPLIVVKHDKVRTILEAIHGSAIEGYLEIKNFVMGCIICQQKGRLETYELLHPIKPAQPFDQISIDFVGSLPITKKAESVATFFVDEIISRYSCSKESISDKSTHFNNKLIEGLCQELNINHIMSSSYYHQTNGQVKRFNLTLCR